MQLQSGRDLSESLFDVLGYCSNTERVRIGSLAENTHPQIKEEIHDMLTSDAQGFSEDEAHSVIESSWTDTPENMRIKTTGDLQQIFSDLKVTDDFVKFCTVDIYTLGRKHVDLTNGMRCIVQSFPSHRS